MRCCAYSVASFGRMSLGSFNRLRERLRIGANLGECRQP